MVADENVALVRRIVALLNRGDLDGALALYAPDFHFHGLPPGTPPSLVLLHAEWELQRRAFPDWHITIEDLLDCGDRVVACLTFRGTHQGAWATSLGTLPPTGRHVRYQVIDIQRVVAGQVTESRGVVNAATAFRQLGATLHPGTEGR